MLWTYHSIYDPPFQNVTRVSANVQQRSMSGDIVDPPDVTPPIPEYIDRGLDEPIDNKKGRLLYQSRKRGMTENGLLLRYWITWKILQLGYRSPWLIKKGVVGLSFVSCEDFSNGVTLSMPKLVRIRTQVRCMCLYCHEACIYDWGCMLIDPSLGSLS